MNWRILRNRISWASIARATVVSQKNFVKHRMLCLKMNRRQQLPEYISQSSRVIRILQISPGFQVCSHLVKSGWKSDEEINLTTHGLACFAYQFLLLVWFKNRFYSSLFSKCALQIIDAIKVNSMPELACNG